MSALEDRVWSHAKKYRNTEGQGHGFARFLFVNPSDLEEETIRKLSDEDKNVLSLPCMQDKTRVFDVVYNRTAHQLGEPLGVHDNGIYLIFHPTQQ